MTKRQDRKAPRINPISFWENILFKECLLSHREDKNHKKVPPHQIDWSSPEEILMARDELLNLPEMQRKVMLALLETNLTTDEIAKQFGISYSSARTHVNRAFKHLRRHEEGLLGLFGYAQSMKR